MDWLELLNDKEKIKLKNLFSSIFSRYITSKNTSIVLGLFLLFFVINIYRKIKDKIIGNTQEFIDDNYCYILGFFIFFLLSTCRLVFLYRNFLKAKYIIHYNIDHKESNNESLELIDEFKSKITHIGKEFGIFITEENNVYSHLSTISITGSIGRSLDGINHGNFHLYYLGKELTIEDSIKECRIGKINIRNQIEEFTKNLSGVIKKFLILLAIKKRDYSKAFLISKSLDKQTNLYYDLIINHYKLHDSNISEKEKLFICGFYIGKGIYPNCFTNNYIALLYKNGFTDKSITLIEKLKNTDPHNPARYISRAFLYLANNDEKSGFKEYEKMRIKFSDSEVIKVLGGVIEFIEKERKKKGNFTFDIGIIYLNYYYYQKIEKTKIEFYLKNHVQSKIVKKRLKKITQ